MFSNPNHKEIISNDLPIRAKQLANAFRLFQLSQQFPPIHVVSGKTYLNPIRQTFSRVLLSHQAQGEFTKREGLYLYSNDIVFCKDYLRDFTDMLRTYQGAHPDCAYSRLGVVVGNGCILSLLPELPVDDVILLDTEPAVHYFLLKIRDLILETDLNQAFDEIKSRLTSEISKLTEISFRSKDPDLLNRLKQSMNSLAMEMESLGDKHFLSSKQRFLECRQALTAKELLPVDINLFDHQRMQAFGDALRRAHCQLAFINLSNVAEYDHDHRLIETLKYLPMSQDVKIISTKVRNYPGCCFISFGLKELMPALEFVYQENEPKHEKEKERAYAISRCQ